MWSHSSDISGCLKVIFSNLWVPISRSHLFFECQLKMNFERCSSIRSWRDVESSKSKFDVSKKLFWITRLRTQSSSLYSDFLFILRIQLLVCDLDKPACLHFIINGIAHLSPATTRYDNKFYIIKLVIKLYIWSQFCELAMDTDVSKTSRVL